MSYSYDRKMNTSSIIDEVSRRLNFSKEKTKTVIDEFIEVMSIWIKDEWKVLLRWFWTFYKSMYTGRETLDLRTWERVHTNSVSVVKFKPWKSLKRKVR